MIFFRRFAPQHMTGRPSRINALDNFYGLDDRQRIGGYA